MRIKNCLFLFLILLRINKYLISQDIECLSPCYECLNNENICISCIRGYYYNQETQSCFQCPTNKYMLILDGLQQCQYKDIFTCQLKYTDCSEEIIRDDFECPRDYPLLSIENNNECCYEYYDNNKHIISNNIIKIQWLNQKNILGEPKSWYMATDFSSKGDLIIETFIFNEFELVTKRYFYGIKSNGREFFYNEENNNFINQIMINSNTNTPKYESKLIKINLVNDNEHDFFLCVCFSNYDIEIIDFYNNKIIGIPQGQIFNYLEWSSNFISIFELNNEKRTYLFCYIGKENEQYYISLEKIKFYNSDISQQNSYVKILSTLKKQELEVVSSYMFTCIEISSLNIIQCFYIDNNGYLTIGLFKEDSLDLVYSIIIDNTYIFPQELEPTLQFHQCIHLKKEISILGYILKRENPDYIYIKIKQIKYKYSQYYLEDYLFQEIKINENNNIIFGCSFYLNHLIKINDNKFSLVTDSLNDFQLYIIIFDIFNFHDTNLLIRYYSVPMIFYNLKIFQLLTSLNYNGFIGVIYNTTPLPSFPKIQYFSLFSYINGTDSELIILDENTTIKLSNYINNETLENNIFGVDLYKIKILKLPNKKETGIYYFSEINNNLISENDLLSPEDIIHLIYDYDKLNLDNNIYTIEFAGVVKEKLYTELLKFSIYNKYYGITPPDSLYSPTILIGRTCFYNFTIRNQLTGNNINSCKENCKFCYNDICIKCIDDYFLIEENNSCQKKAPDNNYYYNPNSDSYKKCHQYCKSCFNGPIYFNNTLEIEDTNCNECKEDYYKLVDTNNCVNKNNIPISYYLDLNKGYFFKCYEKCKTCKEYKLNSTYLNCILCDENSIFYPKSSNCLDCVIRNKYVNYYQYDCIDIILDGFYLYDEETKIIDSCYITCKHCEEKGDYSDHKCKECAEAYPYNYNNGEKCLDDCSKENLFADLETKICYNDCKDNINDKKYNYKNICVNKNYNPQNYKLDNTNNFISICNPQKEYEFNNECYNKCPENTKLDNSIINKNVCICNNLYYLNGEEKICINSNICPNEYPYLKLESKECSVCPVTYKGKCYLSCPENTCITTINNNLSICIDKYNETKILAGFCFDDFLTILDNIENIDENNNKVVNINGVSVNIYQNGINYDIFKDKYNNLTYINLGDCAKALIEFYGLEENEKLYILSVDYLTKISHKVTNDYKFEVYLRNRTQLENISICNHYIINISTSIIKMDLAHIKEADIFYSQGFNIYNLSSDFYIDKCSSAHINENDIIIKDIIKDIYPYNITFCPKRCELINIDIKSRRVNCYCNISINDDFIDLNNYQSNEYLESNDNFFFI